MKAVAWVGGLVVVAMNQPAPAAAALPAGTPGAASLSGFVEMPGRWKTALGGVAGPMAVFGAGAAPAAQVLATEQKEPGIAAALLLAAATGEVQKRIAVLSTEYVTFSDVAGCEGGGAVIAGSFGGTLRVGERGVSTGGLRDGFVAVLDAAGVVTQLVRMGGDGDDGVLAADCRGDEVVVVGTISEGAELFGKELPRLGKTVTADGMLIKLRGGELAWQIAFGGPREDLPLDVALTARGDVAVVGMARGELSAGPLSFSVGGPVDGYLARWAADGTAQDAMLLGGADYDATTKVVALGERLAIAGFFSGTIELGGATLTARGGDDAMLIVVDGRAVHAMQVGGEGREEIAAMAAAAGSVVLGIGHTAGVAVGGLQAPSPADPLGGAAVVTLPLQ